MDRDICKLLCRYLSKDFWIDGIANLPILIYVLIYELPIEPEEIEAVSGDAFWFTFMALKTLRLYHAKEIADSARRLFDKLGDIFYMKRYMLQNILSWSLALLKFVLSVHYFSCIFILIHRYEGDGFKVHENALPYSKQSSMVYVYFETVYLMTSTISTVGFGDFKGFISTEPIWAAEMTFLIFFEIIGIILFSTVTNEIFNYR